ncbi:hypothetical protein SARC_10553 [Sphaeroforma arctica JP610]|uniref:Uncharacterized protein n=1 Tax=Sphaeroforma arctica JP610 TaxID=667725 RepID=A0A0L0FJL3_9EUKA|nr:hypothetical protein SARC_10553 [Sphaeroforma arctica JP610]KNC76972.1 hypothetical protein SARC_10553 [Sphaeroforma arctica JP610]|eukprot:XP_014150874.1 hypothetical protein SARC_10553 [Sphaeroforma arctica JP610]
MTIVKRILLGSLRDKAVLFITHNTGYFKGVSDSAPVTTEQRLPPQRATAAQVHSHSQSSPEPIGYSATRGTTPGDSGAVPDSKNWALPPNGGSSGAVQDSNDRTMPPNTASDNVSRIPESEQAAITPLPCHKETPTTVPNQNVNGIPVETSAESPSLTHSKHSQPVGSCRVAGEAFTRQLAYYAMEDGRLTMQQRGESVLVSDACAADSGQVRTADDSRGVEPTDITGPNMPCPEVSGNRTAGDVLDSPGSDAEEEALEECESGVVHRSVYRMYAVEMGLWLALAVFVSMTGM